MPVPGLPWILVQNVEKSEVMAPVIRIRNTMLIIGAICAALGEENIRGAMEEQGQGSKLILDAIGQLNEITRQVRTSSVEMLQGANEIISEGRNLEKATCKITDGMADMAASAGLINTAVNEVNSISGQNKEIIDNLVVAVSRFKV